MSNLHMPTRASIVNGGLIRVAIKDGLPMGMRKVG